MVISQPKWVKWELLNGWTKNSVWGKVDGKRKNLHGLIGNVGENIDVLSTLLSWCENKFYRLISKKNFKVLENSASSCIS